MNLHLVEPVKGRGWLNCAQDLLSQAPDLLKVVPSGTCIFQVPLLEAPWLLDISWLVVPFAKYRKRSNKKIGAIEPPFRDLSIYLIYVWN